MRKPSTVRVNHIPITKARINLGQLAKRVHLNKEYFIVEKDGIPVVGIMDADELEDYLELQDPTVKEFIAESHKNYVAGRPKNSSPSSSDKHQERPRAANAPRYEDIYRSHHAAL